MAALTEAGQYFIPGDNAYQRLQRNGCGAPSCPIKLLDLLTRKRLSVSLIGKQVLKESGCNAVARITGHQIRERA
ncbi:hypothetical protein D3C78_1027650 [compost metagenome]